MSLPPFISLLFVQKDGMIYDYLLDSLNVCSVIQ